MQGLPNAYAAVGNGPHDAAPVIIMMRGAIQGPNVGQQSGRGRGIGPQYCVRRRSRVVEHMCGVVEHMCGVVEHMCGVDEHMRQRPVSGAAAR